MTSPRPLRPSTPARAIPRGRVLLVDDDEDVLAAYRSVLVAAGHQVDTVMHGEEALRRLAALPYDAVLSDIGMPGMSGIEFLRRVRSRDLDVAVVLMTADPQLETAIDAVQHGAAHYLVKPVDRRKLIETIGRATRLHGFARARREADRLNAPPSEESADLESRFERALDTLWPAFQPIVSLGSGRVFAYEALMRVREPSLPTPPDVLQAAERLGRLPDVGRAMRRRIAERAGDALPGDAFLFVNLHPRDLLDEDLYAPDAPLAALADRVVLEITERASLDRIESVDTRIRALRRLGYRFALDDLGAGYAGLTSVLVLEPEVVKLDMALVRGVDKCPAREGIVRAIVAMTSDLGMDVVAEGVETGDERDALSRLGCDLLQGYHFGRPAADFAAWAP